MAVQIPLKGKYRSAQKSTYKGGEKPAPKKHRSKVGQARHEALFGITPPRHLVVDGRTGKSRMENA